MNQLKNRTGFTLIEIMVVIVILAMLAALVGPKLMGRTDDAKIQTTRWRLPGKNAGTQGRMGQ
jgi:prepilin-type N-terminal cleavage/methylation domain-containing protein